MARRTVWFFLFCFVSVIVFWLPLTTIVKFALQHEHYSHTILIPLVTASLIYWERRRIFSNIQYGVGIGGILLLGGGMLYFVARSFPIPRSPNDSMALAILPIVLLWIGGFVFWFGRQAFRAAAFPLLFLFLMVPIPELFLRNIISALQSGSAAVAYVLFKLSGVPIYREGLLFALPGLTIEVAEECSGIRSNIGLLVTSLLAGHFFLRSGWQKGCLSLLVFPIVLLQNGLRIVTICLLSIYVDWGFLSGSLHRRGGIVFFLLSLALLAMVLRMLQRFENWKRDKGWIARSPERSPAKSTSSS